MKKSILFIASLLLCFATHAQHQIDAKGFSYQGYAREAGGTALSSTIITVRFSINVKGSATAVFTEEHASLTTDAFGVFHTVIGSINTVDYKALAFDRNNYEMKVEVKTAATNYTILSNAELLAVPYAKAAGNGVPPGTILPFAGGNLPTGYLLCNGDAQSRTAYPALFAAIGGLWGAGNGSTTFNMPDLRDMFLRGTSATRVLGTYEADDFKGHAHAGSTGTSGNHNHRATNTAGQQNYGYVFDNDNFTNVGTDATTGREYNLRDYITAQDAGAHTHTVTINPSGGTETRPKNKAVLYIIKY